MFICGLQIFCDWGKDEEVETREPEKDSEGHVQSEHRMPGCISVFPPFSCLGGGRGLAFSCAPTSVSTRCAFLLQILSFSPEKHSERGFLETYISILLTSAPPLLLVDCRSSSGQHRSSAALEIPGKLYQGQTSAPSSESMPG